ncbi:acyl-CoA dehydrogenase family protein [Ilumatobacter sp.]|uniref:acyl-CoA dehydrogenase family protein n=1 Tax=Ilumatobacter sp. TaxID=1967498 RepID=UPI003B517DE5
MTISATQRDPETDVGSSAPHWTGVDSGSEWLAAARRLAPRLAERSAKHDRDGTFVADCLDELRAQEFMSLLVPLELGGGGASHAEACAVLSELARGCPSTSLSYSMHSHVVGAQVWRHRHDLPAPVLGKIAADQMTMISTGASDWIESSGDAVEVDGGFRVSARKSPASGCPAGDVLVTSIRWDDAPDGPHVIHCSVPFGADGVSVVPTWDTMGMRGTGSDTVVLDDVFVPDESVALVRPAGSWHPVWSIVLGTALPLIMSVYVGIAEAAAERAIELVGRRAERPEVAVLTGRMLNRLAVGRDTVRAMIDASDDLRFDNTLEAAALALTRKTNATEACIDTVRTALEVGGGPALGRRNGIEQLFRDVHGALYHPLPATRQECFTGRLALGLDPLASA